MAVSTSPSVRVSRSVVLLLQHLSSPLSPRWPLATGRCSGPVSQSVQLQSDFGSEIRNSESGHQRLSYEWIRSLREVRLGPSDTPSPPFFLYITTFYYCTVEWQRLRSWELKNRFNEPFWERIVNCQLFFWGTDSFLLHHVSVSIFESGHFAEENQHIAHILSIVFP